MTRKTDLTEKIRKKIADIEVMSVKQANIFGERQHQQSLEQWHKNERQFYPPIAFYKWFTPRGFERTRGFVAISGKTQIWRPTKKGAIAEIQREIKKWTY